MVLVSLNASRTTFALNAALCVFLIFPSFLTAFSIINHTIISVQFSGEIIEITLENYLKNFKVLSEDKKPTLAGILFFSKKPQQFLPYAKIIAAHIEGADISIPPSDKKDLEGNIMAIIEDSLKFLKLYLKEEHRIKGFEPEVYPEIPLEVLREGIVNAIAHRDYTIIAPIRLFIFQDRIEIRTPGKLPNTVTPESMKIAGSHVLRNPTIYNMLYKIGMVTDIGSGVYRMNKVIKEKLNREIELIATESEFLLSIPRIQEKII